MTEVKRIRRVRRIAFEIVNQKPPQINQFSQYAQDGRQLRRRYQHAQNIYRGKGGQTYYDVGFQNGNSQVYVWYWDGTIVHAEGPFPDGSQPHVDHLSQFGTLPLTAFKGRYDASSGQISVQVPPRFQHRELPPKLLTDLKRKFPNSTALHVF